MPYTEFLAEIFSGFKVIEWTRKIAWNKQKGIITSELKLKLQFFFSAHHLIMPYISTKFYEETFTGFKIIVDMKYRLK